jgi:hypothetical protein
MTERQFAERIAMPVMLVLLYVGPAAVSAIDVAILLNGHMRGLSGLLFPVVILWSVWQGHFESNSSHEMAKITGVSWLAGLPIGLVGWLIAQQLSRFFA